MGPFGIYILVYSIQFRVPGALGFRTFRGLGFRVWGRVQGLGFRVDPIIIVRYQMTRYPPP